MTRARYTSHWITLGGTGYDFLKPTNEQVTIDYPALWRNEDAVIRMHAQRYRHSDNQWSEWQIYPEEARFDTHGDGLGSHLTDLAKRRLGDQHRPMVERWIAGPEYHESESQAYVHAVVQQARELRPYSDPPSRDLRVAVEVNKEKLPAADRARLLRAADAYDGFVRLLKGE